MTPALGILGGGQLGRMLALVARRMGYRIVTLDPQADAPAGQIADVQIVAPYDDRAAVEALGAQTTLQTYEFESIPPATVQLLEERGCSVRPSAHVLTVTQDRLLEKRFVRSVGLATAPFAPIDRRSDLAAAIALTGLPAVLKTRRGGYDGKGQWAIATAAALEAACDEVAARLGEMPPEGWALLLEGRIVFERELSVIAARGHDGRVVTVAVAENEHVDGILARSILPARVSPAVEEGMHEVAARVGAGLGVVGVFTVECFLADERVVINEIAPRVHNSGHATLEAASCSQYEAHLRAIAGLPLVQPRLLTPAVMLNVLGSGEGDELAQIDALLALPEATLHLYGKQRATPRRKMGHLTILAPTIEEALTRADRARPLLTWTDRPNDSGHKAL